MASTNGGGPLTVAEVENVKTILRAPFYAIVLVGHYHVQKVSPCSNVPYC